MQFKEAGRHLALVSLGIRETRKHFRDSRMVTMERKIVIWVKVSVLVYSILIER